MTVFKVFVYYYASLIILQIILFYSRDPFLNLSRSAVKIMYIFATLLTLSIKGIHYFLTILNIGVFPFFWMTL